MKRIKQEKVKRGRIILSSILTFLVALISLGFGAYLGYVTININYLTLGTVVSAVGGLLVVAGFFIFFGCIGGVISLKQIFISSRNEEKFSAYKGSLISSVIYYCVIALISIVGIIMAVVSYIPSNFVWSILGLAVFSLLLCGGAFYCVLKELKEHKKKTKSKPNQPQKAYQGTIANMELDANSIHKLSDAYAVKGGGETLEQFNKQQNINGQNYQTNISDGYKNGFNNKQYGMEENMNNSRIYGQNIDNTIDNKVNSNVPKSYKFYENNYKNNGYESNKTSQQDTDFVGLAEKLMQLEELRKAGLINDQEYQALKSKCIWQILAILDIDFLSFWM